jgi:hypothetical protein
VNQELSRLSYRKFIQYYQESDQLAEYTIKTELPRMAFRVVRHGEQMDDKQQIEDVFDETPFDDIWRMANQSIFADILVALQRRYLRADLSLSIVSTTSSFTIDLDSDKLQALSLLHITVPSGGGKSRLQLCSFAATVDADLRAKTVQQAIGPPDLKFIFDEQILDAAETIDMYTHSAQSGPLLEVDLQRAREQLMAVGKQLTYAGEGLLEGVVGSLGRIVGADQQHGRRGSNGAAFGGGGDGNVMRLYRRDDDVDDEAPKQPTKPPTSPVPHMAKAPVVEQAQQQDTQQLAAQSAANASGNFTPRSGGLFGTWFKVAEKVATVGQLGVQFALAVGEEVAKAAVRQANEEDADHKTAEADFRFPRPEPEFRPSSRSTAAGSASAAAHDVAETATDQGPGHDTQQDELQQRYDDDDKVTDEAPAAAAAAATATADNDEDESSDGEIAEEDAW